MIFDCVKERRNIKLQIQVIMAKGHLFTLFKQHRSRHEKRNFFKRRVAATAFPLLFGALPALAQDNPWFFGIHTRSNHVLVNDVLAVAGMFANIVVTSATDGATPTDFTLANYHRVKLEDNGEAIKFKGNNPYGYKAYDLFNDIEAGLKIGWQGAASPVGLFVYAAYGINQYKLRFLGERSYSRHEFQSIRAGIGARISPLRFLMDEHGWCPIIELGTTYVSNFSYKGPNGNDRKQINNGMRSSYAIGAQFGDDGEFSAMLCMDMAHYDIFNRDYTPDGGFWHPYANFKSKEMNFSLRFSYNLFDD